MKCPRCDAEMDVKPFGTRGARACRCTGEGCKTYFVIGADNTKTTLPAPKRVTGEHSPRPPAEPRRAKKKKRAAKPQPSPQQPSQEKKIVPKKTLYDKWRDGEL
jgi:hypothetical protein